MGPDLGGLAVLGVYDVDDVEVELLAGPLGADRRERDRMVLADQHTVQPRADRAGGEAEMVPSSAGSRAARPGISRTNQACSCLDVAS